MTRKESSKNTINSTNWLIAQRLGKIIIIPEVRPDTKA